MYHDRQDVDELEGDENEEGCMVARPDARIDPRTVVVVPLNAPPTHVAVKASRHGNDLALKAEFIDFKALQQLGH